MPPGGRQGPGPDTFSFRLLCEPTAEKLIGLQVRAAKLWIPGTGWRRLRAPTRKCSAAYGLYLAKCEFSSREGPIHDRAQKLVDLPDHSALLGHIRSGSARPTIRVVSGRG